MLGARNFLGHGDLGYVLQVSSLCAAKPTPCTFISAGVEL